MNVKPNIQFLHKDNFNTKKSTEFKIMYNLNRTKKQTVIQYPIFGFYDIFNDKLNLIYV